MLLKEYVNAAAAKMADAEVEAYMALYSDPSDSTIAQRRDGIPIGEAFDPASLPVVPLVAFFASKPLGGSLDAAGSLWTVQAWGPGGLTRLAEYPARRQPAPGPPPRGGPPCSASATWVWARGIGSFAPPRGDLRRRRGDSSRAASRTAPSTRARFR